MGLTGAATHDDAQMGCGAAQLAKAAGHDDAYTVIANSASVEAGMSPVRVCHAAPPARGRVTHELVSF